MSLRRTGLVLALLLLTSAAADCPHPWEKLDYYPAGSRPTNYVVYVGDGPNAIAKVMGVIVEYKGELRQYHLTFGIHMNSTLGDSVRWESGDCANHIVRFPSKDSFPFMEPSGGPDSRSIVVKYGTRGTTFHLNPKLFSQTNTPKTYTYTVDGKRVTAKERKRALKNRQVGPDVVADG